MIKGYGWLDPDDHEVHYGTNGMPDIGADTMYYNASEKGSISTIPEIPGLAVWNLVTSAFISATVRSSTPAAR